MDNWHNLDDSKKKASYERAKAGIKADERLTPAQRASLLAALDVKAKKTPLTRLKDAAKRVLSGHKDERRDEPSPPKADAPKVKTPDAKVPDAATKPAPELAEAADAATDDAPFKVDDPEYVKQIRSLIKDKQRKYDLDQFLMNMVDDPSVSPEMTDKLAEEVAARMDEVEAYDAKNPLLVDDGLPGMKVVHDDTPEIIAAQKTHFDGDGDIAGAPAEGLWNHVRSDPDRFEVKANGNAGKSVNNWVTDKKTGEKWMFKEGFYDGEHMVEGDANSPNPDERQAMLGADAQDIFNENLSHELMVAAGFDMPDTKFAASADARVTMMAQRHYGEQFGGDVLGADDTAGLYTKTGKPKAATVKALKDGPEPEAVARMVVTDFLMNNAADRHRDNAMMVRQDDGSLRLAIIDQGLGFEGSLHGDPPVGPDADFDEFYDAYRAANPSSGGWDISSMLAGVTDKNRDTLREHLYSALEGFSKVEEDAIAKQMQNRAANLSEDQQYMMEEWLGVFMERRDFLADNIDSVIDRLANEGGF